MSVLVASDSLNFFSISFLDSRRAFQLVFCSSFSGVSCGSGVSAALGVSCGSGASSVCGRSCCAGASVVMLAMTESLNGLVSSSLICLTFLQKSLLRPWHPLPRSEATVICSGICNTRLQDFPALVVLLRLRLAGAALFALAFLFSAAPGYPASP